MEILNPIDMSFVANKSAEEIEALKQKIIDKIMLVLPKGYFLSVYEGHGSSKYVFVHECDSIPAHDRKGFNYSKAVMYWNDGVIRTTKDITTPNHVYRLCGLMQLLLVVDVSILGHGTVIENEYE